MASRVHGCSAVRARLLRLFAVVALCGSPSCEADSDGDPGATPCDDANDRANAVRRECGLMEVSGLTTDCDAEEAAEQACVADCYESFSCDDVRDETDAFNQCRLDCL